MTMKKEIFIRFLAPIFYLIARMAEGKILNLCCHPGIGWLFENKFCSLVTLEDIKYLPLIG